MKGRQEGVLRQGGLHGLGARERRETRCSRPSTPSSRCGTRASTRAAGVACADYHMPYQRGGRPQGERPLGAESPAPTSTVRASPATPFPEKELESRVLHLQDRHHELLQRAATATTDLLDAMEGGRRAGAARDRLPGGASTCIARPSGGSTSSPPRLPGGRAPQELARILGETIDLARQGELAADRAGPEEVSEGQPVALLCGQDLVCLLGYAAIALQVR